MRDHPATVDHGTRSVRVARGARVSSGARVNPKAARERSGEGPRGSGPREFRRSAASAGEVTVVQSASGARRVSRFEPTWRQADEANMAYVSAAGCRATDSGHASHARPARSREPVREKYLDMEWCRRARRPGTATRSRSAVANRRTALPTEVAPGRPRQARDVVAHVRRGGRGISSKCSVIVASPRARGVHRVVRRATPPPLRAARVSARLEQIVDAAARRSGARAVGRRSSARDVPRFGSTTAPVTSSVPTSRDFASPSLHERVDRASNAAGGTLYTASIDRVVAERRLLGEQVAAGARRDLRRVRRRCLRVRFASTRRSTVEIQLPALARAHAR